MVTFPVTVYLRTNPPHPRKKTLVRAALGQGTERDDFHFLDRWQQAVVMRLHTGHNRLSAHMSRKMKLAPSPTSNCGLEDQTAEHILQRCPLLQTARQNVWPSAVQLYTPNSPAARRNWRRQPYSSCRLDSQCRGNREERKKPRPSCCPLDINTSNSSHYENNFVAVVFKTL